MITMMIIDMRLMTIMMMIRIVNDVVIIKMKMKSQMNHVLFQVQINSL